MEIEWIDLIEQKPTINDKVLVFRNFEIPKIEYVEWSESEAFYADWNQITHWCKINLPTDKITELKNE